MHLQGAAIQMHLCNHKGCINSGMTSVSSIPDHQLSITCGLCKHHSMLEVANLIGVGEDATAHDVRQRYSFKPFFNAEIF